MSGGGQWRSKFSWTNEQKLTNKLFTYIHAWSPFFPISLHSGVQVGRGKHPFCLHFGNTGIVGTQHWYTIKANDNRESLLFAFFCSRFFFFLSLLYFPLTFLLFFFHKENKTNGKIRIWGFPDVGFFFFSERKPTLCLSSSDVRKCPKVWLHVSEERKTKK